MSRSLTCPFLRFACRAVRNCPAVLEVRRNRPRGSRKGSMVTSTPDGADARVAVRYCRRPFTGAIRGAPSLLLRLEFDDAARSKIRSTKDLPTELEQDRVHGLRRERLLEPDG